jgi:vacuolar protein sorting-associated protein 13D
VKNFPGKVELENLPLKKDALRHLGLPIEIKAGFIGKVKLQIPVRQIRSAPWVIAIEQLYFVASPLPVDEVIVYISVKLFYIWKQLFI